MSPDPHLHIYHVPPALEESVTFVSWDLRQRTLTLVHGMSRKGGEGRRAEENTAHCSGLLNSLQPGQFLHEEQLLVLGRHRGTLHTPSAARISMSTTGRRCDDSPRSPHLEKLVFEKRGTGQAVAVDLTFPESLRFHLFILFPPSPLGMDRDGIAVSEERWQWESPSPRFSHHDLHKTLESAWGWG